MSSIVTPQILKGTISAKKTLTGTIVGTLDPDNVVLTSPIEDSHGNTITDHDDEFIWGNTKYTKV